MATFGIVEFGWAIYGYTTVNNAATEGARRGMVLNRFQAPTGTVAGNAYHTPGNSTNTYAGSAWSCDTSSYPTIMGRIMCNTGVLDRSRITVTLTTPQSFPANIVVPPSPDQKITVVVQYVYKPLITYPFNFGTSFTMTGRAESYPQ